MDAAVHRRRDDGRADMFPALGQVQLPGLVEGSPMTEGIKARHPRSAALDSICRSPRNRLSAIEFAPRDQAYLMLARYYSSSLGRFMAVDPVQRLAQSLGNPQRWNRFTYALNNPVGFIDPDGRDVTVPKNMRSAVISGYMHSSEFRQQFDAAKSNHNINVTLKLVEPVGGGVRPGEKASSPELKVTPNATDLQGKPVVSEGFKVEGNALIPAGKGEQEAATMAGHELKHANDMSVSGPQTPGTPAATAGQTAAEGSEAQIREEYKDPADDVSKAQAEAALKGTEPKKKTKDK
jgi:RHS repeat-associated protein